MGKNAIAEESVREYANKLIANKEFVVGLALGQNTGSHFCVIHFVKTPLQDEETEKEEKLPKKSKSMAIENWNPSLVALHAKQVTRMLLGGLHVLGLFICTPNDTLPTTVIAASKKMLSEIRKAHAKPPYQVNQDENDQLLIHVSCLSRKITCNTIDVTSSLATPKSIDIKFQSTAIKWNMLRCQLAIDLVIPISKEATTHTFINQIKKGLDPFCKSIWKATSQINGILRKDEELLDSSESKGSRGKRTEPIAQPSSYEVDLLLELNCIEESTENADQEILERNCGASVQMRGTIEGRAYISGNPTVNTAVQCLKQDIVRSLISRCEVHCEDLLVIDEEQHDRVVVHELPCRIFVPLPNQGILVSDYIFPGETADDSLRAFQELLDINVGVEDVVTNLERLPDSSDLLIRPPESDFETPFIHASGQNSSLSWNYTFLGLSIAIACIAGGASYFMFLN